MRETQLAPDLYGEGLTIVDDEIIQLTWQAGRAFRWNLQDFEPLGEFAYQGEGWGICYDGMNLLMSDGSATLTQRNPQDFSELSTASVRRQSGELVNNINELECVDGLVVANIWLTNEIVVIQPNSGVVLISIDASNLAEELGYHGDETSAVLNGIAYLGDDKWILGGKNWPKQFLVKFSLAKPIAQAHRWAVSHPLVMM